MKYKDKYIKMFLRFIKELNLNDVNFNINNNLNLENILSFSLPTTIAYNFFVSCSSKSNHHFKQTKMWENNIFNEFKIDLINYTNNNNNINSSIKVFIKKISDNDKNDFIKKIQFLIDNNFIKIEDFYNTEIN